MKSISHPSGWLFCFCARQSDLEAYNGTHRPATVIVRRRKYYEYGVENGVDNCYCPIRCCVYECMR
ncbi:head outer capsid protein [Escherichia coli phage phiS]